MVGKSDVNENPVVSLDLDLDFGLRLRVCQHWYTTKQHPELTSLTGGFRYSRVEWILLPSSVEIYSMSLMYITCLVTKKYSFHCSTIVVSHKWLSRQPWMVVLPYFLISIWCVFTLWFSVLTALCLSMCNAWTNRLWHWSSLYPKGYYSLHIWINYVF